MNILDIHTHHKREGAIINCSPSSFSPHEGYFYSVGIHPWSIDGDYLQSWELLQNVAVNPQVLAIGEAGIDKLIATKIELQTTVFEWQAELASSLGKPLIIHAVRSSNELIHLIKKHCPHVPWIIHGFRGNKQVASQYLSAGFHLSYGEKFQTESLLNTPFDRMFIESDESKERIETISARIASALGVEEERFRMRMTANATLLYTL